MQRSRTRETRIESGQQVKDWGYEYDLNNRLTAIKNGPGQSPVLQSFGYDLNGNRTSKTILATNSTTYYDWTDEDKLYRIRYPSGAEEWYIYDADGTLRAIRDRNNSWTYLPNGGQIIKNPYGAANTLYPHGNLTLSALLEDTSGGVNWWWVYCDQLGSTREVRNDAGYLADSYNYQAYGSYDGNPTLGGLGESNPYRFAGGWGYISSPTVGFDPPAADGLMLLGARWYDPTQGRFISEDPSRDGDNWYAYGNGQPTFRVDPSGNFVPVLIAAVEFVGAVVVAVDIITDYLDDVEDVKVILNDCSDPLDKLGSAGSIFLRHVNPFSWVGKLWKKGKPLLGVVEQGEEEAQKWKKKGGYRGKLQEHLGRTDANVSGMHAHHGFPVSKGQEIFDLTGGKIDANDPQHGWFWDASDHLKSDHEYRKGLEAVLDEITGKPGSGDSDAAYERLMKWLDEMRRVKGGKGG